MGAKIRGKQVGITEKIRIPKGVRSQFTPTQMIVLAVVYLASKADHCKLTVSQIAQRAGISIGTVCRAIVLAGELGVLDVIVDHEGRPTVIRNVAIKATATR